MGRGEDEPPLVGAAYHLFPYYDSYIRGDYLCGTAFFCGNIVPSRFLDADSVIFDGENFRQIHERAKGGGSDSLVLGGNEKVCAGRGRGGDGINCKNIDIDKKGHGELK